MSKFNFNIDVENIDSLIKSKNCIISLGQQYELTLFIVDLELPSGTLWAKYNLGAKIFKINESIDISYLTKLDNYIGRYYSWGEIEHKEFYKRDNYKFGNTPPFSKYNNEDKLKLLQLEDDAAYQNGIYEGSCKYKIPTKELFEELLRYTSSTWVYNYKNIFNLNGNLFTGKNGNELFFPAVGYCNGDSPSYTFEGYYWTSSLNNTRNAYSLYFNSHDEDITISYDLRWCGLLIKPIFDLQK